MKDIVIVHGSEAKPYGPPGHAGTFNTRLAGPFNGSENVEFCIGTTEKGGGAHAHVHKDFDQLMYVLEGKTKVISNDTGEEDILEPGDLVRFPAGVMHQTISLTDTKVIVIYGPPKQHMDDEGNWVD